MKPVMAVGRRRGTPTKERETDRRRFTGADFQIEPSPGSRPRCAPLGHRSVEEYELEDRAGAA